MQQHTYHDGDPQDQLPKPDDFFSWPQDAAHKHEWKESASRWAVLRKAYPNHPATWFQGANAHMEAGELNKAENLLVFCRQQFPNHPNSLIFSATLAMHRHKWDMAKKYLAVARERHSDNLQTWLKSAECAEKNGDIDQAVAFYESACHCTPSQATPFIQYAELFMRTERWEEALIRWEIVREHFPKITAGFTRAADASLKLGRPIEARKLLLTQQYGTDILNTEHPPQSLPSQKNTYTDTINFLELIWTKAAFNLRSEVNRNYLSYGWWVLEPLLHMAVFYVVFGHLMQRGGENFPIFLLTGLIPWMWFMKSVSSSSSSILSGQNLMLQVGLPSSIFPLIGILQASMKQVPIFALLCVFVWSQGYSPGSHWWALIPVIIVQTLLTISFSCTVAAIIPFFLS
ncbi:MAG: phosphate ABC transporter permease [Candidatus Thiodiazotropha sp. (ex Notomyrtea botanica)]|nr:phosphate ABC transporter permease [Candidatus Thiodiazotropha sp. (ex Notomyrtea botanica)]